MISILTTTIIIVFYILLILGFFSEVSLFFSLVLLGIMLILMSIDLKKKELHKYYLISLFLTAIIFILSNAKPVQFLIGLFSKASLSLFTTAFILIYILAHLSKLVDDNITDLVEKYRK